MNSLLSHFPLKMLVHPLSAISLTMRVEDSRIQLYCTKITENMTCIIQLYHIKTGNKGFSLRGEKFPDLEKLAQVAQHGF